MVRAGGTLTRLADGTLDARYELNDQLGNARVIFHKPQTVTYQATMEPGQAEREEEKFTHVAATRFAFAGVAYDGTHVARLNAAQGLRQGPSKTLTVEKGDTVTFSAAALYQGTSGFAPRRNLALIAGALAAPPPTIALPGAKQEKGAARKTSRLPPLSVGLAYAAVTSLQRERPTEGVLAWLHYRLLDSEGTVVDEQYEPVAAGVPDAWQRLQLGVRIAQAGRLEVAVVSEDPSRDVFFDQVTVAHTGSPIVQEQHQYAFGSPLTGLNYTVGDKVYRHGYQGQFAEKDAETGYDSFELRLYNSRIGRWTSYDLEGQFHSPYVGMGNNPASAVDSDGGWSWIGAGVGALIGAGVGGAIAEATGGNFWRGAAIGGAIGGLGGGAFTNSYNNYAGGSGVEFKMPQLNVPNVSPVVLRSTLPVARGTLQAILTRSNSGHIMPIDGATISSEFGPRCGRNHNGVDMVHQNRNLTNGLSVRATASGRVVRVVHNLDGDPAGVRVAIVGLNGMRYNYYHLQIGSNNDISVGDRINQGDNIGRIGGTGFFNQNNYAPHLHYEIWNRNNARINPAAVHPELNNLPRRR